eukprot:gene1141-1303_t
MKLNLSTTKRVEMMHAAQATVELGTKIQTEAPSSLDPYYAATYPFTITIDPVIVFFASSEALQSQRQVALKLLQSLPHLNSHIVGHLSHLASDQLSLDSLWSLNGIIDVTCTNTLLSRIPTPPGNLGRMILGSLANGIKCGYIDVEDSTSCLTVVLQFVTLFSGKLRMESGIAYEELDVLGACLDQCPDDVALLSMVLSRETEETLAIVQRQAGKYSRHTWISFLLPWATSSIGRMKLAGVSGIQSEQAVIDLVRECARIFYLDAPNSMAAHDGHDLGSTLITALIEAMRHGYIETERLPLVTAIVLVNHLPISTAWFDELLSDRVCHNHRTSRAIFDVFLQLLGYADIEESSLLSSIKIDNTHRIFHKLVSLASLASFRLVSSCCKHRRGRLFLLDNPGLVNVLLQSMKSIVHSSTSKKSDLSLEAAESLTDLLNHLVLIIHPYDAPLLFNLALQILTLLPAGYVSPFGDEGLGRIIDRVTDNVPLCMLDIELGLAMGGADTKLALCDFAPQLCILDLNPAVRVQALHVLAKREELVIRNSKAIIDACKVVNNTMAFECELAISAAPMLGQIAFINSDLMVSSITILYRAVKLSSQSDPESRPDTESVCQLNYIIDNLSTYELVVLLKKSTFLAMAITLKKYCIQWKHSIKALTKRGVLVKNKNKEYHVMDGVDPVLQQTNLAETLFEHAKSSLQVDIAQALDQFARIKREYPDYYITVSEQVDAIIGNIKSTYLDSYPQMVGDTYLDYYPDAVNIYNHLAPLIDSTATKASIEQVMDKSRRKIIVDYFLGQKKDAKGARQWLKDNAIRDPLLFVSIDQFELNLLAPSSMTSPPIHIDYPLLFNNLSNISINSPETSSLPAPSAPYLSQEPAEEKSPFATAAVPMAAPDHSWQAMKSISVPQEERYDAVKEEAAWKSMFSWKKKPEQDASSLELCSMTLPKTKTKAKKMARRPLLASRALFSSDSIKMALTFSLRFF